MELFFVIEWICFGSSTGYGVAAANYVLALDSLGIPVRPFLLDSKYDSNIISEEKIARLEVLMKNRGKSNIQVYHMIPDMHRKILRNKYRKNSKIVSWAIYETISPPELWIESLNKTDFVLVPSQFCKKQFFKVKRPMSVVPHCLDINEWKSNSIKNNKFTFLFLGTWQKRKGYDYLLEAWSKLDLDAELWIKTNYVKVAEKATRNFNNIKVFGNRKDIVSFMNLCHCVVSPSRGEAFGLVPMQSLSLGIPIIVTNFGGFLDYASSKNALLLNPIEYKKISILDNIPQFRNKKWPILSSTELAKKMKFVYQYYSICKKMAERGQSKIHQEFNYNTIGNKLSQIFDSI